MHSGTRCWFECCSTDHPDEPWISGIPGIFSFFEVSLGPGNGGFRIIFGPGRENRLAGERAPCFLAGVGEGLEWVDLGPGGEEDAVFSKLLVIDAKTAVVVHDREKLVGAQVFDQFEKSLGSGNGVGDGE